MTSIRVHLSDVERTCAIENEELGAWNKALIERILFAAAKTVSADPDQTPVSTTVTFHIAVDPEDGSIVIEI